MAICDAQYCFTVVDIGNFGRDNDAQIFNNSEMGRAFISGNMNIPSQAVVDGFTLPHVLVSDEIFALKTWLMKRSPRKDLNEGQPSFSYRLSSRTIENSFGILAARWEKQKPVFSIHFENYYTYMLPTILHTVYLTILQETIPQSARYHDNSVAINLNNR